MLRMVLVFLILSLVAGFFGFTDVALISSSIAKILFMIFVVLFILSSLFYMTGVTLALIWWAFIFLFIAVLAGALGFTGLAIMSAEVARLVFMIFVVLFVVSMMIHLLQRVK